MPVIKVPIVHKFGIISHSQRLELQERLLKEAYAKTVQKADATEAAKNPFEISDDFIKKYNLAQNTPEAENYENQAQKILLRVKRRVGLKNGCVGAHVNIPYAWTELTLLAQCKGQLYEECLDILLLSLDQAPIGKYQIPALFYLAETVLYWLQTDSSLASVLRPTEIKLLKIGELVFYRLYYHNMSGQLQREDEAKIRLAVYLEGFDDYEHLYDPYPYTKLSFSYISSVGKTLTAGLKPLDGEAEKSIHSTAEAVGSAKSAVSSGSHQLPLTATATATRGSGATSVVTAEVHRLSPLLWHGLDVWRCSAGLGGDLQTALRALWQCVATVRQQNWIDAYVAIAILTDASKLNIDCLRFMQALLEEILFNQEASEPMSTCSTSAPKTSDDTNANSQEESHIKDESEPQISKQEATTAPSPQPQSLESLGDLWTWRVAVTLVQQLCHVTLHGSTSHIRQTALVGTPRVSLVGLINFQQGGAGQDLSWAWRVRYTALQSVVVVSEASLGDPVRECLRNVSLDTISRARVKERDHRVLEAIKIGKIITALERQLNDLLKTCRPTHLGHRIAHSLAGLYLPPLPSPVAAPPATHLLPAPAGAATAMRPRAASGSSGQLSEAVGPVKGVTKQQQQPAQSKFRTTLNEEIDLSKSLDAKPAPYYQRQDFCLFRVVEDQWRKDLHMQMEQEDDERNAELLAKHEETQKKLAKIQAYKDRRSKKTTACKEPVKCYRKD